MHKTIPNNFTFISEFKKAEISNLKANTGIIFRNYEKKYIKNEILKLKQFCKSLKKKLYLANDVKLAINLDLDGAYIPAFNKNLNIPKNIRKNKFIILGSAHNYMEMKFKEKQGVKIIFISPLFKTKGYKNGMGIIKFNILSKFTKMKIVALGGINNKNIKKLKMINVHGFSGISYFK